MGSMKIIKWVMGLMIVFILVVAIGTFAMINELNTAVSDIVIEDINLSLVSDGIYFGEYNINDRLIVEVEVSVENGVMTNVIILRHDNGMGSAAEGLRDVVLSSQSLDVDVISGATGSSKVILKAIENALEKGL